MPDDPSIPPALSVVRDLTDEEYDGTYATGDAGHELPPDVLGELELGPELEPGEPQ